jgi:hypothetical protein
MTRQATDQATAREVQHVGACGSIVRSCIAGLFDGKVCCAISQEHTASRTAIALQASALNNDCTSASSPAISACSGGKGVLVTLKSGVEAIRHVELRRDLHR